MIEYTMRDGIKRDFYMNIIEVKNNLVKLCYEDELVLSGLILISDNSKSYIAQVLHMEATRIGKVAVAKIIFNYNNGISAYDGSIPSLRAELKPVDSAILLDSLDKKDPLNLGKLAEQQRNIVVNIDVLKDNPIVLAEKFFTTKVLLNNLALQLQARKQKIVVFDTASIFKSNKITVTKDFKLPLNNSTINYIYEKGFEDATAESKAMIQAIFEELSEYSKTVEFIPFDTFKAVVDAEFMRTKLIQLIILKNKIKQIRDWNVFAQNESEFGIIKSKLENEDTVVIDISCLKDSLQKECIKYVYSLFKDINAEFYAFTPLSNENSDKFILQQFSEAENVHTTTICGYDYKYITELKKRSKNMLMFTPLKQQKDFGGYNIFLQKLAEDEFIAYGKMTKFVPLIGKLHQLSGADIYIPKVAETLKQTAVQPAPLPVQPVEPVVIDETPVAQTVNELPDVPETEIIPEEIVTPSSESVQEEIVVSEEENIITEEPVPVSPVENNESAEAAVNVVEPVQETVMPEETPLPEQTASQPVQEEPVIQVSEAESVPVDETKAPEPEIVETPEIVEEIPADEPIEDIFEEVPAQPDIQPETPVSEPAAEVQSAPAESPSEPPLSEVDAALNEVPDIEDDEELSDDDLDMIEELSKPDEEIAVINEEPPVSQEPAAPPEDSAGESPKSEAVQQQAQAQAEPETTAQSQQEPQQNIQPQTADDEIQNAKMPEASPEPLQTRANTTPVVPVYPSDIPDEDKVRSDKLQQGDRVMHQEFGEGVVEKMINYGDKLLCSVNFASVGRRLLNPEISEMRKI